MGLRHSVVDVFIAALNQQPGDRSGVVGRLTNAVNTQVTHYNPGAGKPARIVVKQRNGFATLPTTGHDAATGTPDDPAWANPELLGTLGEQMLSIANSIPRVWNGTDWTKYGDTRVITNRLSETVFHTSQHTIVAPDSAYSNGVTCSVWVEQTGGESPSVIVYVGFKADDGSWIRTPTILYNPDDLYTVLASMARVCVDATGEFFWVVYNEQRVSPGAGQFFNVKTFDLSGALLAEDFSVGKVWISTPGYWDMHARHSSGMTLAQPLNDEIGAADGVRFTAYSYASGSITLLTGDQASIHCRGPLAWLTNDLDANAYLAVLGDGSNPAGRLWGYQMTALTTVGHEYNFAVQCPDTTPIDSLIGWPVEGASPNQPTLFVSFTVLAPTQTVGPPNDPQLRYSQVYQCTWADAVTLIRQNNETCQVSRAFKHNDEYHAVTYYQSGSGLSVTSTSVDVTITAGDGMTGAPEQPIAVALGDFVEGSTFTATSRLSGVAIWTSGTAPFAIQNGDTVGPFVATGLTSQGVPDGTLVAKWIFAGGAFTGTNWRLNIAGSTGVTAADGDYEVVARDPGATTTTVYTTGEITSGNIPAGTFDGVGPGTVTGVTMASYAINDTGKVDSTTRAFFVGSTMVVSGSSTPANNGTKTIARYSLNTDSVSFFGVGYAAWVVRGSETAGGGAFSTDISPLAPNRWGLGGGSPYDTSYVGSDLVVAGDTVHPENNSTGDGFQITFASGSAVDTGTATALTAEVFANPLPSISVVLPLTLPPYKFLLQSLTFDYTYIGALISVTGSAFHTQDDGVYQITGMGDTTSEFLTVPLNGLKNQVNQLFSGAETITIFFRTNVSPEFQPTWFITPLTGVQPQVGKFETGIAFADWRFEPGTMDFPANLYPLSVSSVVSTPTGIRVVLPYRAISFTSGQSLVTPLGQVVNAAVSANLSTVGIKQFTLSTSPGLSVAVSGELMLPGPMASEFTASGFHENGINLGLEQPFVVAQNDAGNLQQNGAYQYVAVAEVTDENGERVFSIPSPPLNVTLTGPNTQVQIGGRVPQPFDGNGVPISAHFGTTNRRLLTLSIYRTSYVGGVPTTQHYKLTNDLNVNGLAPVSTINTSGFSFPDEFTWYYSDNNPDVNVVSNEILYTDKGFLPRFPAPPNRGGAFWKDRPWVIGYDGAVWMGGEKTEGDAAWFFPGYRFIIPSTETAVSLAKMDDYLLVLCSGGRNFYIPATTFPNAAGKNGTLPNVVEMPFTNGCTGFSETLGEGVVYSSTAGGVWLVTRDVKNGWISQPIQDSLATLPISSIVVDKRQRLHVTAQTGFIYVYDQVVQTWYTWLLPTARAYLMTILDGEAAFQDDEHVWLAGPTLFADNLAGTKHGTPWDVTFASLNFANVRGLKSVWEMQLVGDYKGEHHLNAILSYPDDQPDEPTTFPAPDASPFTPDPTLPYLLAINPAIEQASSYGLRVFVDFDGIDDPGNSSELELVSCEVGMDPIGVNKFNDFRRIPGR